MEATNGQNACKGSSKSRGGDGNSAGNSYQDEGTKPRQMLSSFQSNDAEVPNSPRLLNSPHEGTVSEPELEATVPSTVRSSSSRKLQGRSAGRTIHYHTRHLHCHHHYYHRHYHYLRHPTSYPAGHGNGSSSDAPSPMQLGTESSSSGNSQMDWTPPHNQLGDQQTTSTITTQSWRQKPLNRNQNGNGGPPVLCKRCKKKPVAIKVHPCGHSCLCRRCAVALWKLRKQCPVPNCTERIRKISNVHYN